MTILVIVLFVLLVANFIYASLKIKALDESLGDELSDIYEDISATISAVRGLRKAYEEDFAGVVNECNELKALVDEFQHTVDELSDNLMKFETTSKELSEAEDLEERKFNIGMKNILNYNMNVAMGAGKVESVE